MPLLSRGLATQRHRDATALVKVRETFSPSRILLVWAEMWSRMLLRAFINTY